MSLCWEKGALIRPFPAGERQRLSSERPTLKKQSGINGLFPLYRTLSLVRIASSPGGKF
jgi:hypothetical protein